MYKVTVSTKEAINFPSSCVVCGRPYSGIRTLLDDMPNRATNDKPIEHGRANKTRIPIHRHCKFRISKILFSFRIFIYFILVAVFLYWLSLDAPRSWDQRLIGFGIVILAAGLWEYFRPIPFDYDNKDDKITFTFKNEEYADDFAALNNAYID